MSVGNFDFPSNSEDGDEFILTDPGEVPTARDGRRSERGGRGGGVAVGNIKCRLYSAAARRDGAFYNARKFCDYQRARPLSRCSVREWKVKSLARSIFRLVPFVSRLCVGKIASSNASSIEQNRGQTCPWVDTDLNFLLFCATLCAVQLMKGPVSCLYLNLIPYLLFHFSLVGV